MAGNDLDEILKNLTDDPQTMQKLSSLADEILSNKTAENGGEPPNIGQNADDLKGVMALVSALQNTARDDRAELISALRPFLSDERKQRADRAVTLMKLSGVLPLISGVLP